MKTASSVIRFFPLLRILTTAMVTLAFFAFQSVWAADVVPVDSVADNAVIPAAGVCVLETDTFRYEIGADGRNLSLFDKIGGKEYVKLSDGTEGACAYVTKNQEKFPATAVTLEHGVLHYDFAGCGVSADVKTTAKKGRIIFEIGEVTGEPDEFVFVNVPLTLNAKPEEPFATCALALNPFTHVHQLPALHNAYWAEATLRFGLTGAKAAMVGVAQSDILPSIRETMTTDSENIPFSDKGGAWALDSEDGYGSYLMNYGSLSEESVDRWIETCHQLGFKQIDNHGGRFFHFGTFDYQLPGGWESFKRIIDKCHAAGIKVLLHTYACYINPDTRYVTPIPHPDLDTWNDWTLAEPISADTTEITVNEPIQISERKDWTIASAKTLRIGDEIIEYSGVSTSAPWKFTGCVRGFHDTQVSDHAAGDKASLLKACWGARYVAKPDSELWRAVAKNHADVVNQCGFDGIYFDAIEGMQHMWGKENYWYYGGKFVMDVAKDLKRPVGMEFAGMLHNWWHYRSRYQAWDTAKRGFKRFIDVHLGSMKAGEEYQHGCWNADDDKIDHYAGMKEGGLYLPYQLGWWDYTSWGDPNIDPTYRDDFDYIGSKLVGNNSGFAFNQPADSFWIDSAFNRDLIELLGRYEFVRAEKIFDESICAKLREPKKEFRLEQDADGNWFFRRMFFKKHKVENVGHPTATWTVENEFADQPFQMRLVPLFSPATYDDPEKTIRFDVEAIGNLDRLDANTGVTGALRLNADTVPATGEAAFELSATNEGTVPAHEAWAVTPIFTSPPERKADVKLAIGVWICGDGAGEILNFMLGRTSRLVRVDFTGWRYVELLEADSTEVSHYAWPPIGSSAYTVYSAFGDLNAFRLWFNNIPAGKTVRCKIGPITTLPYRENEFQNPAVTVNGQTVRFPVTLKSGMYVELRNGGAGVLYDEEGNPVENVTPSGSIPTLKSGTNEISVTTDSTLPTSARMEVTVIGEGEPLK